MPDLPTTYEGDTDVGQINYVYCHAHDRMNTSPAELWACATEMGDCDYQFGIARHEDADDA